MMKTVLMMIGMWGLVGCQAPADVKKEPVRMTLQAEAPYKLLGSCLQQHMRDESGIGSEQQLDFQDWVPSAELVGSAPLMAGSVDTVYVLTLVPNSDRSTHLSVKLNRWLMDYEVERFRTLFEKNVKTCESLINNSPQ